VIFAHAGACMGAIVRWQASGPGPRLSPIEPSEDADHPWSIGYRYWSMADAVGSAGHIGAEQACSRGCAQTASTDSLRDNRAAL